MIKKSKIKNQKSKITEQEKKPKKSSKQSSKTPKPKKQPQTMEELLAQTGYHLHGFKRGEIVEGKIVSLSPKEILIDIGGKTEGTVARKELPLLKSLITDLKKGDKITCRILLPEGERGRPLLSLKEAGAQRKWENLEKKVKQEEEIEVLVKILTRGGILVDWQNLRGFIPLSQLDPQYCHDPKSLLGKKAKVKILEADQSKNRLVLSQKAVTQKEQIERLKKHLKKIRVGQVLQAEVTGVVPFGLFCQADGLEGLVHISEISWEKVEKPGDFFKVSDEVRVKVLEIDHTQGKLNLSIKQLTLDPWQDIQRKYKNDQIIKGKVARLSSFGAFISLERGVEGLIHVSKIPPDKEFKEGEKIECVIEEIDARGRKISLSYLPKEIPVGYK